MEFGCRYIYVDDQNNKGHVEQPDQRVPQPLPRERTYDACDPDIPDYDYVQPDCGPGAQASCTDQQPKTNSAQALMESVKANSTQVTDVRAPKRNSISHPLPRIPNEIPESQNHDYLDVLPAVPTDFPKPQKTTPPVPARRKKMLPVPAQAPTMERSLPANCNILLLNVGKMLDVSENRSQEKPSLCRNCSAALSELNGVTENKTWTCVFCGTENSIIDHEKYMNIDEDQLYLWDPQGDNEHSQAEDSMLIFCIDISGSMSVTTEIPNDVDYNFSSSALYTSRMEAVKSGLLESLYLLYKQCPNKRVALITFSDQIKIYGDGTIQPQVLEDSELLDPDYLRSQGENQPMPHRLGETLHALESKIEWLTESGATALGPAALVSIAMASQKPGSKVIICTDGRANTDLGNLEDITEEFAYQSSKLYYSSLADLALQQSVVVSVLTIEGTDCRLPELGQLADKTGGKVNIVHPLKLANEFQSILEEEINAINVKVKVYLPNTMHFLYEGHTQPVLERSIGSTTPDTVLSLEIGVHSAKIPEVLRNSQVPMQVQLTFSLLDGRSGHRIISQKRPVTNDSSAAVESISLNVLQIHSAQLSARLAMEGRVEEASQVALALKDLIDEVIKQQKNYDNQVVYDEWESSMYPIYEDLKVYVQGKSVKKNSEGETPGIPVTKSFTDEMANMMFHLKKARSKVLKKLKPQVG
ncbi:circularly permutated Ras protein 1-like isoform 1-T3 [Discoglossus pictus]